MRVCLTDVYRQKISLAHIDLFTRSARYYQLLRSERGRFTFLAFNDPLFPQARLFDPTVQTQSGDSGSLLSHVEKSTENMLVIGDGGMGKTTSLLKIWETELERKKRLPIYVPLNEYNGNVQENFIERYIRDNYQLDINKISCSFLLLLDGFNEVSVTPHKIIQEIKELSSRMPEQFQIILTSRTDFDATHHLNNFQIFHLEPLSDDIIDAFIRKLNLKKADVSYVVLGTPMMLTLFAQNCSIQEKIKHQLDVLTFKPSRANGELIYNFLLCQIAKLIIDGKFDDIFSTYIALFMVAPFIAHSMESKGSFVLRKDELPPLIKKYFEENDTDLIATRLARSLALVITRFKIHYDRQIPTVESILVNQLHFLVEDNRHYAFQHQHFRDFFSALHISNQLEDAFAQDEFELPQEISSRALPIYIRQMLGDYYSDYQNADSAAHPTPLHTLLAQMRGKTQTETGLALNNIIETWKVSRRGHIIGEDLSKLDFTKVPMNGLFFSNAKGATSFAGSVFSEASLLPQGHSGDVNSAVYSPDGRRILSASDDGSIKEWDCESGKCLWTSPPYSGIYILGCDMTGCIFASAGLEEAARGFGGKLFRTSLIGIAANQLRHHESIQLSIKPKEQVLILTGLNGSGKTSLLNGISQSITRLLTPPETISEKLANVQLRFYGAQEKGFYQTLRAEVESGQYIFIHLNTTHLLDDKKTGFWEYLDKIQATINQAMLDGKKEQAEILKDWLGYTENMLKEILSDKTTELRFNSGTLEMELWQGKKRHGRNALPHGYSAAIDILSHLLNKWNRTDIRPDRMYGLMLIDELESHLHVRMQKCILPCLMKFFPNVQFIVTTHSPFILNSVKNALVYDMDDLQEISCHNEDYGFQGWTVDEILEKILEVNSSTSAGMLDELKKYDEAFDNNDEAAARKAYAVLDKMLSADNPLRKMLRIQMTQFGGVEDD